MKNICLIIYFVMIGLNILIAAFNHGKPKKGNMDFFATLIGSAIGLFLILGVYGVWK